MTKRKDYINLLIKVAGAAVVALLLYYAVWMLLDGDLRYLWPFSWGEMLVDYLMCFCISLVVSIVYWRSYTKVQRERDRFKLKALENQINPHFVFNNFSILSGLIDEDPQKAQKFLMNLSKVYRYNLSNVEKTIVPIAEELKFLEQYVEIMKSRFGETFRLEIAKEVYGLNGNIAPCSLQMLVENALKHNEHTEANPLYIRISSEVDGIMVSNNLQPLPHSASSTKMGNSNLKERYSLLSSKQIKIDSTTNCYTVTLPIL